MKYSFGEADQRKGVVVGEIGGLGMVTTSFRELAPRRDVRVIRGRSGSSWSGTTRRRRIS